MDGKVHSGHPRRMPITRVILPVDRPMDSSDMRHSSDKSRGFSRPTQRDGLDPSRFCPFQLRGLGGADDGGQPWCRSAAGNMEATL